MNFLELVKNRYSCRNYKPQGIEEEKLKYILECVRFAPSAVNKQPWKFRIVNSNDDKAKIQQCYDREWFATAPTYIIASVLHNEEWVRADGKHHGNIDVSIAVEHLCLAATEQGLATCWVCNFDAEKCKNLFGMSENEEPAVLIPIGYANDQPKEKKRKPLEEITEEPSQKKTISPNAIFTTFGLIFYLSISVNRANRRPSRSMFSKNIFSGRTQYCSSP